MGPEDEDDAFMRQYLSRRRKRKRRIIVLCVCLFVVPPVCLVIILRVVGANAVRSEIQAVIDRGEPIDFNSAIAHLPEPTDQIRRTQELYRRAFDLMSPKNHEEDWAFSNFGDAPNVITEGRAPAAFIRQYIARNREAIDEMRRALPFGPVFHRNTWGTDFTPIDQDDPLASLGRFRAFANLFLYEAMLASFDGDADVAVQAISDIGTLGNRLTERPNSAIAHLVRIAIQALAVNATEILLNNADTSEDHVEILLRLLIERLTSPSLEDALFVERIARFNRFPNILADEESIFLPFGEATRFFDPLYRYTALYDLDRAAFLQYMAKAIEITREDLPSRHTLSQSIEMDVSGIRSIYTKISQITYLPANRIILLDTRVIARIRLASVALAVQRFRVANNRLPASLDDLIPDFIDSLPNDPFTGNPLILKPLETGFTIYSLGEDQADDGGARINAGGNAYEPGTDIPFTITR